ncbi:hypothetical protein GCM10022207_87360 [Streptomyces lannensis]|uniref:Uncharacterized protein n=1 Tax=Streptomyces lannensis TaxID=766498 RepID=A0ABP7LRF4_9ACTN
MTQDEDRQARLQRGMALLNDVSAGQGQPFVDSLAAISPELSRQVAAWGFGEIYARPQLAPRDRQLEPSASSPRSATASPNCGCTSTSHSTWA